MIEDGAKVNHLAYVGDARLGAGANFGAGAIVCNYDGVAKHRTDIGKGAFIGSNAALVAPVTIGDGAYVATGSVITHDVPADALAIAREPSGGSAKVAPRRLRAHEGGREEIGQLTLRDSRGRGQCDTKGMFRIPGRQDSRQDGLPSSNACVNVLQGGIIRRACVRCSAEKGAVT
mgnify:CR=1 FL=1